MLSLEEKRLVCLLNFMWSLGALPDGFPAAYAAYAAGRSYSGYPSFGLPYPAGNPLASLHHQLSGNHYHHLATLLPYHPLELSGVYNVHAMHLIVVKIQWYTRAELSLFRNNFTNDPQMLRVKCSGSYTAGKSSVGRCGVCKPGWARAQAVDADVACSPPQHDTLHNRSIPPPGPVELASVL
ncbi:RNA-binding protein Musashi Rbp6 [Danaus plexippus plexippus]|uniref:RNA-binding protein Musashi Rbp6 n=1 Tax=Danaus plexippus plexippus TaxID=278856 RepID=A0A212F391_DANPL|nr:RNA-binding protein Musashi Rbp6 [Danaus plexippus plexippus]